MNTSTHTAAPRGPSVREDWYLDSAYIDARLREARRLRSEAMGQLLSDGWHALCRLTRELMASRPKPVLRQWS